MTDILLEGGVEKSHCNSQVGVCVYLSSHTKNEMSARSQGDKAQQTASES